MISWRLERFYHCLGDIFDLEYVFFFFVSVLFLVMQARHPSPLRLAPEAWRLFSPGKRFESNRVYAKIAFF